MKHVKTDEAARQALSLPKVKKHLAPSHHDLTALLHRCIMRLWTKLWLDQKNISTKLTPLETKARSMALRQPLISTTRNPTP